MTQTIDDLDFYRSQWLHVSDLKGKTVRVHVTGWELVDVRDRTGGTVEKIALSFRNATKRLLLGRGNGQAAGRAWGDLDSWVGQTCLLQPGPGPGGQETIVLIPLRAGDAEGAPGSV